MDLLINYLILLCIYIPVAMSASLLVGVTGIFSVSQAAIFGIGAYMAGALMLNWNVPFGLALLAAMVIGAAVNTLFALPALRVAGDYFVVTSFGLQLVASTTFESWTGVTGGTIGLVGIPAPSVFGFSVSSQEQFLILTVVLFLVASLAFLTIKRSAFGRLLSAIRQDELAVAAAGKSVLRAKIGIAAISGLFAGAAGSAYAVYMSFIDPSSFNLDVSVLLIAMVVVGGARSLGGAILGPTIITGLPLILTFVELPSAYAAPIRQLAYGVLLIAFMVFRPQGIVPERMGGAR